MENFGNYFMLTGYASQEDIKWEFAHGKLYTTFKVYTTDGLVITFQVPEDKSDILSQFESTESGLYRYDEKIAVNKVKGGIVVIASNLNEEECVLYSVKFIRREIPAEISRKMKNEKLQEGPLKRVTTVNKAKSININEGEYDDTESDYYN